MAISALDHFTILTPDVDGTAQFFIDAMDFAPGPAPDLDFPVRWVYCGDNAAIHIVNRVLPETEGSNRIDHMGFRATYYAGTKARLDDYGAHYMEQNLPAVGLHQIFVKCPHDIWLELNFALDDYLKGSA